MPCEATVLKREVMEADIWLILLCLCLPGRQICPVQGAEDRRSRQRPGQRAVRRLL